MKRTLTLLGLLMFLGAASWAQGHMDQAERNVRIVQGPNITDVSDHSAKIEWITNTDGANHVVYRVAGSNQEWQSAYHQGGGTHHFLRLDNLEPGRTYEWQILTRDGDVRKRGEFRTEGRRHGRDHGYNGGYGDRGGDRVTLYRSVNTSSGAHAYTTNSNDPNMRNFRMDGAMGYILSNERPGSAALHIMSAKNGDYMVTTDPYGMERYGYRDEGVIGYIATTQLPGTQPFYRLVKPDGSGHFFTASEQERAEVLRRGWRDEGVAGYIWPQ
jgi:Repeat of unknown function (DUF5648)